MQQRRNFLSLTPNKIAESISLARDRVIYAGPGIDMEIAKAIIESVKNIGMDNVSICIDTNEKPYRLGYGTFEAISMLQDKNITLRHAPNLRIGCLVCDDLGWIFSPTPLLIEAGTTDDLEPNAIRASDTQIEQLISSVNPTLNVNDNRLVQSDDSESADKENNLRENAHHDFIKENLTPEIGQKIISNQKLNTVKQALEENPPQVFDIARKVQVYESFIEFVEINLIGCEIHRHTVSIPPRLLVGDADDLTIRQLRAGFQIIENNSSVSNENLRRKLNQLRKDYLRSIPKYGNVILKTKKTLFLKKVEEIRNDVKEFQKNVETNIKQDIQKSKKRLIDALIPSVLDKPPQELVGQIPGDKPSREQVEKFLELEIDEIFPDSAELIKEMRLDCIFKAVTYETISNDHFQREIKRAYRLVDWSKPFKEYDAAKGNSKK